MDDRENAFVNMMREATVLLMSPGTGRYYIAVESSWFANYITSAMGDVHDCYVSIVDDEFTTVQLLGTDDETYCLQTFNECVASETVSASLGNDDVEHS